MMKYYNNIDEIKFSGMFVCISNEISDKSELLSELCIKFSFPYFGNNWDSLLDLMSDLTWLDQKEIYIINPVLNILSDEDFDNYVQILDLASQRLSQFDFPNLHIYFPFSDKARVEAARSPPG